MGSDLANEKATAPTCYSDTKNALKAMQNIVCCVSCCTLYIQGDSGGICSTLGNDSMCDSKQKSSYEHGSDFERLPRLW